MAEEHGAPSTDINTREVLWKIEDCKVKEWKETGHSKASIEQKSARKRSFWQVYGLCTLALLVFQLFPETLR